MEEPDLEADPLVMPGAMPLLLSGDIFHFPGSELPLRVSSEIQGSMVEYAMEHDEMLAVGCASEAGTLLPVVTAGMIKSVFELADGSSELVLFGIHRMRIVGLNQLKPFPIVRVEPIPYSPVSPGEFDEWNESLGDLLEARATGWDDFFAQISDWVRRMEDPATICDLLGHHLVRSRKILRELLSEESTKKRMEIVFKTLAEEDLE
jgi:ATP-dependent Lon protease